MDLWRCQFLADVTSEFLFFFGGDDPVDDGQQDADEDEEASGGQKFSPVSIDVARYQTADDAHQAHHDEDDSDVEGGDGAHHFGVEQVASR